MAVANGIEISKYDYRGGRGCVLVVSDVLKGKGWGWLFTFVCFCCLKVGCGCEKGVEG